MISTRHSQRNNSCKNTVVPYFVLQQQHIDQENTSSDNTNESNNISNTTSSNVSLLSSRALFTVPEELVHAIIVHPILCCGSSFVLEIDDAVASTTTTLSNMKLHKQDHTLNDNSNDNMNRKVPTKTSNTTRTIFVSTIYDSIDPDHTANEISQRIYIRIQNIRLQQQAAAVVEEDQYNAQQQQQAIATTQKEWARSLLL